jgi:general secretion pathway protein E
VAVAEPPEDAFHQAAEIVLSAAPRYVVASYDDIQILLTERLGEQRGEAAPAGETEASEDDVENLRDLASGAPVVRALNELFDKAMESRATDLHIEPMRDSLSVRLRVDGVLRNVPPPPAKLAAGLISRVKILAGLNIAERRVPQDGAARLRGAGGQVDTRVAVMPTAHGEAAVIRFLPRDRGLLDLGRVGFSPRDEATMRRLLNFRNGMIIITGPTGSGKTTTLAGALTHLNDSSRKILTIEDPIEYELAGVVQSQVNPAVGLTFATALRAFLRLDPNVIMVGEIRDGETAGIAVQAALTGHLVLTTLHTETAAAAVPRLIDLGVEDFLLQSTVRAILAQRLVRVLCEHCKRAAVLSAADLDRDPQYALLGLKPGDRVCEPVGCDRCGGGGYRGRRGVFEILEVTPKLRRAIKRGADGPGIEALAREEGFRTMLDDAAAACRAGETSASEVLRVTSAR